MNKLVALAFPVVLLLACSPPEACSYGGVARAWIDADENGLWDDGERPLAGVQISVSGNLDAAQGGVTDEVGEAKVGAAHMSCGASFSICAEPPPGYTLTTLRCLGGRFPGGFFDQASKPAELLFGFVPAQD